MADIMNDFDEGKKLYDDLRGNKQKPADQNQKPDTGSQQQPDQSTENSGKV